MLNDLTNVNWLVFVEFGMDCGYVDTFPDGESARRYYDKLTEEDEYTSVFITPVVDGVELRGEPITLSEHYK